jgi:hypothetical protein
MDQSKDKTNQTRLARHCPGQSDIVRLSWTLSSQTGLCLDGGLGKIHEKSTSSDSNQTLQIGFRSSKELKCKVWALASKYGERSG